MSLEKYLNVDVKKMKENNRKRELEELEKLKPSMDEWVYEQTTGKKAKPVGTTYSLKFIEYMKTKNVRWNIQNGIHISYVKEII